MSAAADKLLYNQKPVHALWHGCAEVGPSWRSKLRVPGHLVAGAKSVYDHTQGTTMAAEHQTPLDILATRQLIQEGMLNLHCVPTWKQFVDGLTKARLDELFQKFRAATKLFFKESEADRWSPERRAGIRKAQRERRKFRMRNSG